VVEHAGEAEVGLLLENPDLIRRLVAGSLSSSVPPPEPLPPAA
jgi:hypothetical protein